MRSLGGLCALALHGLTFAALPPPMVDEFVDGSGRLAPAVIIIAQLSREVGAQASERGYSNAELTHSVQLSPFAIGRSEVTNAEFVQFLNEAGSSDADAVAWFDAKVSGQILERARVFTVAPGMASRPAAGVSWNGARAYAKWLSRKTGAAYDLPTGVQWEVAARAGTRTTWWWGNRDDVGRYHGIASGTAASADVRTYGPNPWGIYDTSGSVWEWMRDCYAADAPLLALPKDPVIFDEHCRLPEIRGGSFRDGGQYSRPAYRSNAYARTMADVLGFRVVRLIDPKPAPMGADQSRTVALRWQHGGAPATGLIVVENRAGSARVQSVPDGHMQLPLAESVPVHVYDSQSGLKLYEGQVTSPTLSLPEPVWVHGQVQAHGIKPGGASGGLQVRIGSGARAAPMERWLTGTGSGAPRDDRMTRILGVPLPASPSVWTDATLDGDRFDSGWILAADPPQVVAFDAAGRVVVRDIALPAQITPHARLDAGTLRLQATSSLTVKASLPASDLPMPVLVGIRSAKIDAARVEEAGRLLSALDQIDPKLFDFLVLDHGISLSYRGHVHLGSLPPFRAVTLMVHEPFKSEGTKRQVALQAGKHVTLTLTPMRTALANAAARYRSRVVRADGTPVANADVMVVDYPKRFKSRTDANGTFSVDGVGSASWLTVFVDASRSGQRWRGPSMKVFRTVRSADGSPLILPEPEFLSRTSQGQSAAAPADVPGDCTYNDPQYGMETWQVWDGTKWSDEYKVGFDRSNKTINASICEASEGWAFYFAPSPFEMYQGATKDVPGKPAAEDACPASCNIGCTSYTIPTVPTDLLKQLTLNVVNTPGFAVAGAQLYFSPPGPFSLVLEPTPLITDSNGRIKFCNINTNPVYVYYQGPDGYTDGELNLTAGLLRLGPPRTNTKKAKP